MSFRWAKSVFIVLAYGTAPDGYVSEKLLWNWFILVLNVNEKLRRNIQRRRLVLFTGKGLTGRCGANKLMIYGIRENCCYNALRRLKDATEVGFKRAMRFASEASTEKVNLRICSGNFTADTSHYTNISPNWEEKVGRLRQLLLRVRCLLMQDRPSRAQSFRSIKA